MKRQICFILLIVGLTSARADERPVRSVRFEPIPCSAFPAAVRDSSGHSPVACFVAQKKPGKRLTKEEIRAELNRQEIVLAGVPNVRGAVVWILARNPRVQALLVASTAYVVGAASKTMYEIGRSWNPAMPEWRPPTFFSASEGEGGAEAVPPADGDQPQATPGSVEDLIREIEASDLTPEQKARLIADAKEVDGATQLRRIDRRFRRVEAWDRIERHIFDILTARRAAAPASEAGEAGE